MKTGDSGDDEGGGGGNDGDGDDNDHKKNCGSICYILKMSLVVITKALFYGNKAFIYTLHLADRQ